jgi:hypothetical protein
MMGNTTLFSPRIFVEGAGRGGAGFGTGLGRVLAGVGAGALDRQPAIPANPTTRAARTRSGRKRGRE